ncbi:MAG: hypothetical protein FIA99_11535 [Ruminiclostridium sp.]|nr:hypothetical protein [Ruminiclostridium sp.]
MKSFGNIFKHLTLVFAGIFLLNMLIMHVFFGIDVFNPLNRDELETSIAEIRFNPENTPDSDALPEEDYPEGVPAATDGDFQEGIDDPAAPEEGDIQPSGDAAGLDSTYFMTTSEVGFLENLSLQDKLEALSLISKVGREESDRIYDLAVDGITYTEMKDIEAILSKHLDRDEMEKLAILLEKSKKQFSNAKK